LTAIEPSRNRLQRYRTSRAADQHVGAGAETNSKIAGRADIFAVAATIQAMVPGYYGPGYGYYGGYGPGYYGPGYGYYGGPRVGIGVGPFGFSFRW
jgi:hypothetical protein